MQLRFNGKNGLNYSAFTIILITQSTFGGFSCVYYFISILFIVFCGLCWKFKISSREGERVNFHYYAIIKIFGNGLTMQIFIAVIMRTIYHRAEHVIMTGLHQRISWLIFLIVSILFWGFFLVRLS